MMASSPILGSS
ncbi:hypothetical protein VC116063_002137A, partial [Vibrio cholerae O1 str. 116063]